MSPHGHRTIKDPTGGWSPALAMDRGRRFVLAVTGLAGLFMTAAAVAALLAPGWFADAAGFPRHTDFVHDAGAFQLDIGAACCWRWHWSRGWASSAGSSVRSAPPPPQRWRRWCAKRRCW